MDISKSFGNQHNMRWKDITDDRLPDEFKAPIDREGFEPTTDIQKQWMRDGVVTLENFIPKDLIDKYLAVWNQENKDRPHGWPEPFPYLWHDEIKDIALYRPLTEILKHLLGEEAGLHLNLSGMVSTQRDFHGDTYLNPEYVGTRYAAVWMALGDIEHDSGPFQYVPGSHKWGTIRRHKVFQYLTAEEQCHHLWPSHTQGWVARCCEEEIARRDASLVSYTPKAGSLLIWHSNLIHRGSKPINPNAKRPALISHYSTLSSRLDMPSRAQHTNGSWYFVFNKKKGQWPK